MFSFSNTVYINSKKYIYVLDEDNNKLILIALLKEINEYKLANELLENGYFWKEMDFLTLVSYLDMEM